MCEIDHDMKINEIDVTLLDLEDLQAVTLRNDNLEQFRNKFHATVAQQHEPPKQELLENPVRQAAPQFGGV